MSTRTETSRVRQLTPDEIRQGVPAAAIEELASRGIDRSSILRLVGAPGTLRRRIKQQGRLTRYESDRLARLARIMQRTAQVFDLQLKAAHWLERTSRA